jgi:glycogen debranching enzyme
MHDMNPLVCAPAQFWSNADGSVDGRSLCGFYVADVRLISSIVPTVADEVPTPISWSAADSRRSLTALLLRGIDLASVDPRVRMRVERAIGHSGMDETIVIENGLAHVLDLPIRLDITVDMSSMQEIKGGTPSQALRQGLVDIRPNAGGVSLSCRSMNARITAEQGHASIAGNVVSLSWQVHIPAQGSASMRWSVCASSSTDAVVAAPERRPWGDVCIEGGDIRLARWVKRSLDDLDGLRMAIPSLPDDQFLAAGAPWFFTLFGRDSLWAARFILPLDTELAQGTLRTLAHFQASATNRETDADPGKIMHELRAETLETQGVFGEDAMRLPPLYYGTLDATELWIILLGEARAWGMPDSHVEPLLGNLQAALTWMMRYGDADGDGFLEYIDRAGHGLSNQGWKDSGDSIRWRDGSLAQGPIALCEVQGYAYQAAMIGAGILERFGKPGFEEARVWAARLKARFNDCFWVEDSEGRYPAIALDNEKRPVDSLTSNIGHLLGTGILDRRGVGDVVARLMSPDLLSGYGIRTLSRSNSGYSPLSYHCGSVWMHDSAIAMLGLSVEGYRDEALAVARQLLRAAEHFDYQVPELYSGDDPELGVMPYPAACHPQSWSAASSIAVLRTMLDMQPLIDGNGETFITAEHMPTPDFGSIEIAGRRIEYRA